MPPRNSGWRTVWVSARLSGLRAAAAVLGYRAFEYWLPIIPGVLAYVRLARTVRDWDDGEITQSV